MDTTSDSRDLLAKILEEVTKLNCPTNGTSGTSGTSGRVIVVVGTGSVDNIPNSGVVMLPTHIPNYKHRIEPPPPDTPKSHIPLGIYNAKNDPNLKVTVGKGAVAHKYNVSYPELNETYIMPSMTIWGTIFD